MAKGKGASNETKILAEWIAVKLQKLQPGAKKSVTLEGPQVVTVKKRNGDYKKAAMIGGEEFTFETVYAGARDGMICVFKPKFPADYAVIEMSKYDAGRLLTGMSTHIELLIQECRAALGPDAFVNKEEMIDISTRGPAYADYGSW